MILPLQLGHVSLPESHPRALERHARLQAFVIDHPDGAIVVDTGCGDGHPMIDQLYRPRIVNLVDALAAVGIDERSVVAIVNTHLHFDHCGQNELLPHVPVWTTQAELDAVAASDFYTVPEWAEIEPRRLRIATDGEELAPGVRLLATPGHTPGHQSVIVTGFDTRPDIIVGQACYTCAEFADQRVADGDLHDDDHADAAHASLLRLRSLRPSSAYFSHDLRVYCSP